MSGGKPTRCSRGAAPGVKGTQLFSGGLGKILARFYLGSDRGFHFGAQHSGPAQIPGRALHPTFCAVSNAPTEERSILGLESGVVPGVGSGEGSGQWSVVSGQRGTERTQDPASQKRGGGPQHGKNGFC